MTSAAHARWQNDRTPRLNEVDTHCAVVAARVPPNPTFLDENLRGFVLRLSAHFQGFCRDLYTECSQIWIAAIPIGFQATAQAQFSAQLALEKGNPTYDHACRTASHHGSRPVVKSATRNFAMTLQNLTEPLMPGTSVKILDSGYMHATIAEYRGPLGPKGARIYRVLVQKKPRHVYVEVREDQLQILDAG